MPFLDRKSDFRAALASMPIVERIGFLLGIKNEAGNLRHWGLERIHGESAARDAIKQVLTDSRKELLHTSIDTLHLQFGKSGFEPPGFDKERFTEVNKLLSGADRVSALHVDYVTAALADLAA